MNHYLHVVGIDYEYAVVSLPRRPGEVVLCTACTKKLMMEPRPSRATISGLRHNWPILPYLIIS